MGWATSEPEVVESPSCGSPRSTTPPGEGGVSGSLAHHSTHSRQAVTNRPGPPSLLARSRPPRTPAPFATYSPLGPRPLGSSTDRYPLQRRSAWSSVRAKKANKGWPIRRPMFPSAIRWSLWAASATLLQGSGLRRIEDSTRTASALAARDRSAESGLSFNFAQRS